MFYRVESTVRQGDLVVYVQGNFTTVNDAAKAAAEALDFVQPDGPFVWGPLNEDGLDGGSPWPHWLVYATEEEASNDKDGMAARALIYEAPSP